MNQGFLSLEVVLHRNLLEISIFVRKSKFITQKYLSCTVCLELKLNLFQSKSWTLRPNLVLFLEASSILQWSAQQFNSVPRPSKTQLGMKPRQDGTSKVFALCALHWGKIAPGCVRSLSTWDDFNDIQRSFAYLTWWTWKLRSYRSICTLVLMP